MPGQLLARDVPGYCFDQGTGCTRCAGADGVAKGYLVATHSVQFAGNAGDLVRGHIALVGTAEHAGDISAYFYIRFLCGFQHGSETFDALGNRAIDVALRERLGRCGEHRHLPHSGL